MGGLPSPRVRAPPRRRELESSAAEGNSPVGEGGGRTFRTPEYHGGAEKPRGKPGGPPSKAKHSSATDSAKYREGTVKSTPGGE
jgi:hypothetical protein